MKQAISNLKGRNFSQFEEWYYELGDRQLSLRKIKGIDLNKMRQAVSALPKKDFDHFEDWFDDLCEERWAEEVKNDPVAQEYIKLGNLIMSKFNPER